MSLKEPFGISESKLNKILSTLRSITGIKQAFIFGSRAMGTHRPGSDIDIAIEAPSLNHDDYLRLCTKLDDLMLAYKIDVVFMHNIDHAPLLEHIQRVGIRIL